MDGQGVSAKTIRFQFDTAKATQAAAHVAKLAGGSTSRATLIKALYFADKKQLLRIGKTITGDEPVSMEHGPVLTKIYDFIKGTTPNATWHTALVTKGPVDVVLIADPGTNLLTPKELELLAESFEQIRGMNFKQLRAFCHDPKVCPELEEVEATSKPISFETILAKAGKTEDQLNEIKVQLEEDEFLSKLV